MNLKAVKLKNFRGYRNETTIRLNDLTAFIGKNDAGKSTILEALEIFFNNKLVKVDKYDLNVDALAAGENEIEITCVFTQLPSQLIIDAANHTTLQNEHLLNEDGDIEIKKMYTCASSTPRVDVFIVANYPSNANGNDLLLLKKQELKERANTLGVPTANYNGNINSTIRSAIWASLSPLTFQKTELEIDKDDTKKVWDYLEKWMPQFALFKSDRESNDNDREVTDPMKVAIDLAIAEMQADLDIIQDAVKSKAIEVANRTLTKLQEMAPSIASQLTPKFKTDPKWGSLFNLTLASDKDIPVNKRGSGVRRLIVLNFFRAEAERRRSQFNSQAIIYAFEEPENSQHPDHQEMLVKAFQDLANSNNTQVLLTTHNPALAGLISEDDLRFVTADANQNIIVLDNQQNVMRSIADTLGMLPEPLQPKLLVCVEGPHDIHFLKSMSATIHQQRPDLPNLSTDPRVAIFPLGGGTLKEWVTQDYLKGLGIPQYHIYDLDDQANPPYQQPMLDVRARGGKNWAVLTSKRETENYLHPNSIQSIYGFQVIFGDMDDVPEIVARTAHANSNPPNPWANLDDDAKRKKTSRAKYRLNREVAPVMTWPQIQASDPNNELVGWLEEIRDRIA